MRNLQRVHGDQLHELRDNCERTRADMLRHHEIQWDNLELEIARIPRPIMKYSKRLIELFKAETGLIRLKQYDDARRVRHMIDKILPGEEKRFYEEFDASIEAKRERLRQSQKADLMRLDEKLTGIEWTDYRRREREASM
jgi:hypothetical protein